MNYYAYEMVHAMLAPFRLGSEALKATVSSPYNPLSKTPYGKAVSAVCELFENVTRRYGKPVFGIKEAHTPTGIAGVVEEVALRKPFCNLLHFKRNFQASPERNDPKVLIVAPMSGHYATLLRGTVNSMIEEHDVYITDWTDARNVPMIEGAFDLDDFIDYVIEFTHFVGPNTHVIAVCQPAVPALAAAAVMAKRNDPLAPASLTMMGGPIDTRRNPTAVNKLAQDKPLSWFENNVISLVPFPHPGTMRRVYPGFIQLTGFMTMNLEKHVNAHVGLYHDLVKGDCDSVKQHQEFYEEYLAVMDLTAEFYLQTVKTVFQDHALPNGTMMHRGEKVDCKAIRHTAIISIEGERDDICGLGQTEAAHILCPNVPTELHFHYVQPGVGHYGVFNGTRWRTEIQPRLKQMIRSVDQRRTTGVMTPKDPDGFAALPAKLAALGDRLVGWQAVDGQLPN